MTNGGLSGEDGQGRIAQRIIDEDATREELTNRKEASKPTLGEHNPPVETRLLHNVEKAVQKVPLGRVATPDEVKDLVLFLLSSRAPFITGAAIPVDGGKSAGLL